MRSTCKIVALAATGMLLVPQLAAASDLEAEIADMKQRMERMESEIRAQQDDLAAAEATVEHQQEVIEKAALEEREEVSALSAFIEATDFNAWVAVSYNYNTLDGTSDGPGAPASNVPANVGLPHHPNSNTFQLDQAWIEIDKAPTEESRAGAHIDLQAGVATTTATNGFAGAGAGGNGDSVGIYTAYVSYLMPILNGIQLDAGIVPTALGAEVEQTNANFNITRGLMWGFQPVTSTGFTLSTEVVDGFSFMIGMLNDPFVRDPVDPNRAKSLTTQFAYGAEKWGAAVGLNWGRASAPLGLFTTTTANQNFGLLDVLLTADPLDNLSVFFNYDFHFHTNLTPTGVVGLPFAESEFRGHNISVAGRIGILEATGFALRYEYLNLEEKLTLVPTVLAKQEFHTVTGTVDHGLTDNLTMKGELRYDHSKPQVFPSAPGPGAFTTPTRADQLVALVQLIYEF